MFEPGIIFWIVAWTVMAVAFLGAVVAILLGAHALDRQSSRGSEQPNEEPPRP